jgi:hypothetical protein
MTVQKSFKRLVRTRMEKTGESYTAARAALLRPDEGERSDGAPLATSDETIRERTGRGWEEWFDALDAWGAAERTHREIARWLAEQQGIDPLAWNAQAIAMSYERARRGREVGQRADGFGVSASKTVAVPVERLFDAVVGERDGWLPDGELRERTATRPRSARFDWGEGGSRVNVSFDAKGERSTVTIEHTRLADAAEAERMQAYWRGRVAELKLLLEAP